MKATLVDYGASNLFSVRRALEAVGAKVEAVDRPEGLRDAQRIVLPGVGAFATGMRALRARGLDEAIVERVRAGVPLLGICLGMHLLFQEGTEHGRHPGLGLLPGTVVPLPSGVRVPHMGWHQLEVQRPSPVVPAPFFAYFAHSYALPADNPTTVAQVTHGMPLAAATCEGPIWACQFHPEKSGPEGLRLLGRFLE